jgi:hypothetical protein
MVPIPRRLAEGIDKIAGHKRRTSFIVEVLETELQRCRPLAALEGGCGLVEG